MFILAPDLEDEAAATATERVRSYVTSKGGEVRSLEPWGRRRLAYPIQRYHEGAYHIAQFTLEPEHAVELDRNLKLNEQVIRHMIVRLD
jgi:small subunit ribosomal protein S6